MGYRGILIREGLKNPSVLERLRVLGMKQAGEWLLVKVEVSEEEIKEVVKLVQNNLKRNPAFYAHFYRYNELIVVFPERVFRMTPDKATWGLAIAYGQSVGIPLKELDFKPCRIEDETY